MHGTELIILHSNQKFKEWISKISKLQMSNLQRKYELIENILRLLESERKKYNEGE